MHNSTCYSFVNNPAFSNLALYPNAVTNMTNYDVDSYYNCSCLPGYAGQYCQIVTGECAVINWRADSIRTATDQCTYYNNPCDTLDLTANCTSVWNDYICTCDANYYGKNCTQSRKRTSAWVGVRACSCSMRLIRLPAQQHLLLEQQRTVGVQL
jgi:hypothetical protein